MESAKIYRLNRNRFERGTVVSAPATPPKPKLLDQVRQAIRRRHYSDRTEKAYVHWIKRFIFFHNKCHPLEMAESEIAQFLSSLATEGRVSASTQNQAFNALLFLYSEVLSKKIGLIDGVVRAKRPQRLPVVLTKEEVKKVIDHMNGLPRLMAILLYGAGLRLMECCSLRVKDIDFSRNEIVIRAGKGDKDRHTMLPTAVKELLLKLIERNRCQHQTDVNNGLGRVALPNALERKYPNAGREWAWQWVSRLLNTIPIELLAKSAAIIFTNPFCKRRLKTPYVKRGYRSRQARTRFDILLLRIYWKMVTT